MPNKDALSGSEDDASADDLLMVCDKHSRPYQVRLFEHPLGWFMKVIDVDTFAAEVHCLAQGDDLYLADLRVQDLAVHPIAGLARIKIFLGFAGRGRIENYRNRGLGSALLQLVISFARARGFQRITGRLAPLDLKPNPALPNWYRHHGFKVTMEASQLEGKLELSLC